MPARGMPRPGVLRTAVALGLLFSLLSLIIPNDYFTRLDVAGLAGDWGTGKTQAADLAPLTVDNSTSDAALKAPGQRKLFYASGRFWIFYTDGSELVYKSSPDGFSWSERSASLGTSSIGTGISVHFDGTYVHYARTTSSNNQPLYYRRGSPQADGTISWSEAEQTAVASAVAVRYLYPSVSVDSDGHALISYHCEKQNGKVGEGAYVTVSGNSDGTWGDTPAGFPYQLTPDSESEWYTTVHGLTSGKFAATFADHTEVKMVYVKTYDGSSWNPTQSTLSTAHFGSDYSVVAQGDDLYLALLDQATSDIRYCQYTYATDSIGPETTVKSSAAMSSAPVLAMTSANDLYCFWINSPLENHIYYSRMISGVWDTEYTDWLSQTNLTANGRLTTVYHQGDSSHIAVAWETGLASPYDVKFGAVQIVLPNQPPDQPANTSPANGADGQSLTPALEASPFSDNDSLDNHAASRWQITTIAGDYTSPVFDSLTDTANLTTVPVPPNTLACSTTYYWHVSYQDNHGAWSDNSSEWSFTTVPAPNQPPNQPANVSPSAGAEGQTISPTLESSDFVDPDGDSHAASQWQIRIASGDYSSPVFDSQTDAGNLISILVSPELEYSTTYYWRVRHQDSEGAWSDWSAETSFTTTAMPAPNQPPDQPANISPAGGSSDQDPSITLRSSNFADPDGDSHLASQWQVRTASGEYSGPIFDSQFDGDNLDRLYIGPDELAYSTTYYWRVRYQDSQGTWSDWSNETAFTTGSEIPALVPSEDSDGWLPGWAWISIGIAIAFLATAILGVAAYFAWGTAAPMTAAPPPASSGLSCVDAISRRLQDLNKDQ